MSWESFSTLVIWNHNVKEYLSARQAETGKLLKFWKYESGSMETRVTLTLVHLTATTGRVIKQGGIKLIHRILSIIFTELSKKKKTDKENTGSDFYILTVRNHF